MITENKKIQDSEKKRGGGRKSRRKMWSSQGQICKEGPHPCPFFPPSRIASIKNIRKEKREWIFSRSRHNFSNPGCFHPSFLFFYFEGTRIEIGEQRDWTLRLNRMRGEILPEDGRGAKKRARLNSFERSIVEPVIGRISPEAPVIFPPFFYRGFDLSV